MNYIKMMYAIKQLEAKETATKSEIDTLKADVAKIKNDMKAAK